MVRRKNAGAPRGAPSWVGWLIAPALLTAVLAGVAIVKFQPMGLFGSVFAVLFAIPLLWVLTSALWPARADRTCPECGATTLVRLDPKATHGLGCSSCGWRDESQSSWLLAEEEGPLEGIVLEQRRRKREKRHAPGTGVPVADGRPVDTTGPAD